MRVYCLTAFCQPVDDVTPLLRENNGGRFEKANVQSVPPIVGMNHHSAHFAVNFLGEKFFPLVVFDGHPVAFHRQETTGGDISHVHFQSGHHLVTAATNQGAMFRAMRTGVLVIHRDIQLGTKDSSEKSFVGLFFPGVRGACD
jgi:hypothetical protein